MRVTQSMLSNSNLKYISQNYNNLAKLQDQITTGKKISKPSDDPVVAMKGMRYRSQEAEVDQFRRNLNEGLNWMDNADSALDETNQVLQRVRELVVQASNDSYETESRSNIEKEISSLQGHIVALANSKVGDNYIFNGTDTANSPIDESLFNVDFNKFTNNIGNASDYVISYKGQTYNFDKAEGNSVTFSIKPEIEYTTVDADGNEVKKKGSPSSITIDSSTTPPSIMQSKLEQEKNLNGAMLETKSELSAVDLVISHKDAVSSNTQNVEIEVMKGVKIPVNVNSQNVFSMELFSGLESIKKMITNPESTGAEITKALESMDGYLNDVVSTRAELGAQVNRAEMVEMRLLEQKVIAQNTVSNNEDIDLEEAIINLTIQESLHRASLAVGAKIIQPTLMDFLR